MGNRSVSSARSLTSTRSRNITAPNAAFRSRERIKALEVGPVRKGLPSGGDQPATFQSRMTFYTSIARFARVVAVLTSASLGFANPPDFAVQSATGTNVFKLSEAKGKFVALHFLLKTRSLLPPARTTMFRSRPAMRGWSMFS